MLQNLEEKIIRSDPQIKACLILSQGKIAHLAVNIIFWKFYLRDFSLINMLYHAAKFKIILRADPEISACIIFGLNQTKIAQLAQNRIF